MIGIQYERPKWKAKGQHWPLEPNIYVSWSPSELRVRWAPLNRFKPSSKIFYWPFQGVTSSVDLLYLYFVLCLLCLCVRLFICPLWSPAGKGLTSWLSFVVSAVSLSLSHWYPGSGVVLDCIDSWSLHPYLLQQISKINFFKIFRVTWKYIRKEILSCIIIWTFFEVLHPQYHIPGFSATSLLIWRLGFLTIYYTYQCRRNHNWIAAQCLARAQDVATVRERTST